MELEKVHEEKILEAVRKGAESVEYGEGGIRLDKSAPKLEIIIETQEKLRIEKTEKTA
jgi:hypothetical protein